MNYEPNEIKKVLAIYPTKEGLSFSFFENQNSLIKVGNHTGGKVSFIEQVQELIDKYRPDIIVSEDHKYPSFKRSEKIILKLQTVSNICQDNNLALRCYSRLLIKGVFSCFEANNKHEIAIYLAGQFPQLKVNMPPKSQIWQKEHYRMRLFDSVAFAFAYYYVEGNLNQN